jgi:hypothetical protein
MTENSTSPRTTRELIALCEAAGGRKAMVKAINEAIDMAREESADPITERKLNDWIYRHVSTIAKVYLLLGWIQMDRPVSAALGIYPDLASTLQLLEPLLGKTRRQTAA